MEAKELKSKSVSELARLANELRAQIRDVRFKVATRQHGRVHDMKRLRRDLARIETMHRAKRDSSESSTPSNEETAKT